MKRLALASVAFYLLTVPTARAADIPVDLELILAVDVSGSVDWEEATLQRRGYVEAIRSEEVIGAIRSGANGKIAIAYIEWAGTYLQRTVIDWTVIDGPESAQAFTTTLTEAPIDTGPWTSISAAINYAIPMFAKNNFQGTRRVIDISGDGPNNAGRPVTEARDVAIAAGITINGLPIVNNRPGPGGLRSIRDLDKYYRDCVIGGAGAFLVVARDFTDFSLAVKRKLIFEIANRMPPVEERGVTRIQAEQPISCGAGEMQMRGGGQY